MTYWWLLFLRIQRKCLTADLRLLDKTIMCLFILWLFLDSRSISEYILLNDMMNDEWHTVTDLEGSDHGVIEVLSWNLDGRTEKPHQKPLRISGVLANIQTGQHPPHPKMGGGEKRYQFSQTAQW
jgi:hypothetical protein